MSNPTDEQFIALARAQYEDDGTLEFDREPLVSRGDGKFSSGAYVSCWAWVDKPEDEEDCENCGECSEDLDDDGICPNCRARN